LKDTAYFTALKTIDVNTNVYVNKKKVKQSRLRPGVAQIIPGS
jgi:hypothetical protein